eukprot:28984-Eustigmatos_ZCMA.PRE.1
MEYESSEFGLPFIRMRLMVTTTTATGMVTTGEGNGSREFRQVGTGRPAGFDTGAAVLTDHALISYAERG